MKEVKDFVAQALLPVRWDVASTPTLRQHELLDPAPWMVWWRRRDYIRDL
jgi:hypothetical protein